MQMKRVQPNMPSLANLLEGDGMPEHVHIALAKDRTLHADTPVQPLAPVDEQSADSLSAGASGSHTTSPDDAGMGWSASDPRKSLLRSQNTREARAALAARKWDEVTTWNGDYDDEDCGTWGDIVYEAHSGMDIGVTVDVSADITVQVFPVYPFLQRSILQRRPIYDMRGCPTFVLWLPRDLNAHLFWKRRDLLAPFFWNSDGTPGTARSGTLSMSI